MIPTMMLALALWMPLAPAADQAALTKAFEDGIAIRLANGLIDQRAVAIDWAGRTCSSGFTIIAGRDRFAERVDWTARGLTLGRSPGANQIILQGGLSGVAGVASVEFQFASNEEAGRVFTAFERLRGACRSQR